MNISLLNTLSKEQYSQLKNGVTSRVVSAPGGDFSFTFSYGALMVHKLKNAKLNDGT